MIGLPRGVEEGGLNVSGFEEGIVCEYFLMRGAGGEEFEQIHDAKARAADARAPATFAGFDGDAFERFHSGRLPRGGEFFEQRF